MKERPILMHARSINGILAGRKTQTRRIIKSDWWRCLDDENEDDRRQALSMCPYGVPGDRLWVREAWAGHFLWDKSKPSEILNDGKSCIFYSDSITGGCEISQRGKSRPSIFMPRWASRLTLEIIGIRVERVQDISEADCWAEGIIPMPCLDCDAQITLHRNDKAHMDDPIPEFEHLWNDTNGKCAWERNDWCWAVEFRRIDQ